MATFNPYQYEDLLARSADAYATTKYRILLDQLAGRERLSVLNAGCGSGELSLMLARAGHEVLGFDPEPQYVELARQNPLARALPHCSFAVSSIEDFTASAPYDCVLATDVLEHIEDDHAAFAKLASLVRPGGLILVTVPAGPWLFGYHDESLGHYRRYTRTTLRRLVADHCRVEMIRYFGFVLIPVCFLYSKVLRRPYPVAESSDPSRRPLTARVLGAMLEADRRLPLPLGTSLILRGVRT
jgi:2-polyprenyl-3-methyl-5-hydroxy-6-metoxy-1,4-benzoquinol methylase